MRHAEGKPSGLVRSPSPTLLLLPRGWAGGAQHRQPVARRPERSEGHAQKKYQKISQPLNLRNPLRRFPYALRLCK
ncbi:MAG: hypothetical protein RML94_03860 [Bacteroidia bacterium]|nr:hypothetical protein [Bacteroidia bacterium]